MPSTLSIFAILAAVAAVAAAGVADDSAFCGANYPSEGLFDANPELAATDTGLARRNDRHVDVYAPFVLHTDTGLARQNDGPVDVYEPLVVQVHAHIVESAKGALKDFSEATVRTQLDVLNVAFEPANILFVLNSTDRIVDAIWAEGKDDMNMKIEHYKGDSRFLNLFFTEKFQPYYAKGKTVDSSCTYARQQFDPKMGPKADACIFAAYALPGWSGFDSKRWKGQLVVHEVGHWFDLEHKWTQECKNALVVPMDGKTGRCPHKIDACSDLYNFMSLAPDFCWTKLSLDQIHKMRKAWDMYRAPAKLGPPVELFPLEPIRHEGKLPYYSEPDSILAAITHCQPDRFGQFRQTSEAFCGTLWFCVFGLYNKVGQSYNLTSGCLDAREYIGEDGKNMTAGNDEKGGEPSRA